MGKVLFSTSQILIEVAESLIFLLLSFVNFYRTTNTKNSNANENLILSSKLNLASCVVAFLKVLKRHFETKTSEYTPPTNQKWECWKERKRREFGKGDKEGILLGSCAFPILITSALVMSPSSLLFPEIQLYSLLTSISGLALAISTIRTPFYCNDNKVNHLLVSNAILIPLSLGLHIATMGSSQTLNEQAVIVTLLYFFFHLLGISKKENFKLLTLGEWNMLLHFFVVLSIDFILRYGVNFFFHASTKVGVTMHNLPLPKDYVAVSHSGLVGCIWGCILSFSSFFRHPALKYHVGFTVFLVAAVALCCVEISIHRYHLYPEIYVLKCFFWIRDFLKEPGKNNESYPQGIWLIYWFFLLVIFIIPVAVSISGQCTTAANGANASSNGDLRRKMVTVSRKFFHFAAVILFAPCTILAPSMMTLSYAVATCVLFLFECVRLQFQINCQCDRHMDKKPTAEEYYSKRSLLHVMNEMYASFIDEKESKSEFLWTHIGLVCGCALPLWLYQHQQDDVIQSKSQAYRSVCRIFLPHLGVLVLGIGDAMGAICGASFGQIRWSNDSKKTIEGSIAMFGSMLLSSIGFFFATNHHENARIAEDWLSFAFILLLLTVVEACTDQIDNFCLPVVGSIGMLLIFERK